MTVDSIKLSGSIYEQGSELQKKKTDSSVKKRENKQNPIVDKLELSEEAMKLNPIKNKVTSGFYDDPEVLREVALKISQEYPKA